MNKTQAIKLLENDGWTKADALRALESIDFRTNPDELTVRRITSQLAGPELNRRQRSQGAQKGLVTKKTKEIELKEKEHAAKTYRYQRDLKEERGFWRRLLRFVYSKAQEAGFQNPLVEHILNEDSDENNVA